MTTEQLLDLLHRYGQSLEADVHIVLHPNGRVEIIKMYAGELSQTVDYYMNMDEVVRQMKRTIEY